MNVLLTCVGRRHYLVKYFSEALGGKGLVIGADMDKTAPGLTACDRAYQVPDVTDKKYIDCVIEIINRENVQMVFTLSDLEIGLLALNREMIERKTGAIVYVPDPDVVNICSDKWITYSFSRTLGVNSISTFLNSKAALYAIQKKEINFPLIVKPRWGSASIAIEIVNNAEQLDIAYNSCSAAVAKSTLATLGTKNAVIIQEYMTGLEYGVDILFDENCEYQGFTAKRKLGMRSGETDKAVTVDPEPFVDVIRTIVQGMRHRGNLDCDFIEQDGEIFLLEMNPRFGGGYPFTHEAGANHVQRLVNSFTGEVSASYQYNIGSAFAKCDTLVSVPFVGFSNK